MKFPSLLLVAVVASSLASCTTDKSALTIGPRTRTTAALTSFSSCDQLQQALQANVKEQMRVQLLQYLDEAQHNKGYAVPEAAGAADSTSSSSSRQEGVDYSGTNDQEVGVDEADFVKTDGYYIYVLSGAELVILGVPQFGELTQVGTAAVEGYPVSMLLSGDRVAVFSQIYTWDLAADDPLLPFVSVACSGDNVVEPTVVGETGSAGGCFRTSSLTKLTLFNLTDRSAPAVLREVYLEGYFNTGREVDTSVRMVSYAWIDIPGLVYYPTLPDDFYDFSGSALSSAQQAELDDAVLAAIANNDAVLDAAPLTAFLPQMLDKQADGSLASVPFTAASCSKFAMAADATSRGFTSILSLDLSAADLAIDATHVLSNWSLVYASTDTLLVVEPADDWWWYWDNDAFDEATNVHRFDISVPGVTTYNGSGRIDGTVNDQFSISELDGNIRIASTTGEWERWWVENPPPPDDHIFVLAGSNELDLVGRLDGIAVGEEIWSARFEGTQAFLTTFNYIDPLWTIDLTNPALPLIEGEVQAPGVSTYIHPIDAGHLLTIGFGGTEEGLDWSTVVSLFDVTNFANPAADGSLSLAPPAGDGWSWAWSEATYEPKAFTYWPTLSMLAVPVSTYRENGSDWEYYSTLTLINVDATAGLSVHGTVDHSSFYNDAADTWWYDQDIRRSIFMGEYIYAISDRGVTATHIADMVETARVTLPGTEMPDEPYGLD